MYTGPQGSPMIIINLLPVAKPHRASSAMMRGSNVEEDESSLGADDVRRKRQDWGFPKMWDPLKMDQNGWFIVEKWIKKPFKWIKMDGL